MLGVAAAVFALAVGMGSSAERNKPQWEWQKDAKAAKQFTCSDLTQSRWEKLRTFDPPPRALTGFAIKLRECGTLKGDTRTDVYDFLGDPDRAGKKYASWIVGFDRTFGDEIVLTTSVRKGKVVAVERI